MKLLCLILLCPVFGASGWLFQPPAPPPPPPTCDVGELYGPTLGDGHCTDSICSQRCQSMYGAESQGSHCSEPRQNGATECYCHLTCVTGGCKGDPHCTTFDGVKGWGYQGLSRHYLIRQMANRQFDYFPRFEVTVMNKPTSATSGVSTIDSIQLYMPDWDQRLELGSFGFFRTGLRVNGLPTDIPYRYSDFYDYKEQWINVAYSPNQLTQVIIDTSFGLRISFFPGDAWISLPRHFDLKDKTEGLLGRWNDNQNDDFIDATGVQRTRDLYSWDFGDSWCVESCIGQRGNYARYMQEQQLFIATAQKDTVRTGRIRSYCHKMQEPHFQDCAKRMGRTVLDQDQCFNDMAFTGNNNDQEDIVCTNLRNYNQMCNLGYTDQQCEESNKREKAVTQLPTHRPKGATYVFRPTKHPIVAPRGGTGNGQHGGSGFGHGGSENGHGGSENGHGGSGFGHGGSGNGKSSHTEGGHWGSGGGSGSHGNHGHSNGQSGQSGGIQTSHTGTSESSGTQSGHGSITGGSQSTENGGHGEENHGKQTGGQHSASSSVQQTQTGQGSITRESSSSSQSSSSSSNDGGTKGNSQHQEGHNGNSGKGATHAPPPPPAEKPPAKPAEKPGKSSGGHEETGGEKGEGGHHH